ncbi:hypothetical protein MtrunA17_Chr7g0264321 [Medicago truncatula]|uniref:Uncharacterized protein n=1 Tax=Medicago truncatula TaxID=3880 RepID=A0A396H5D8_MEDTR|nr:hypothetical protein MtrunA17_Chr7g0264321 [Medicago truncatula]
MFSTSFNIHLTPHKLNLFSIKIPSLYYREYRQWKRGCCKAAI